MSSMEVLRSVNGIVKGSGEGERLTNGGRTAFVKTDLPHLSVFEFHLDGHFGGVGSTEPPKNEGAGVTGAGAGSD
jgi:hypothetical protein